jgi:hypothetical protein
MAYRVDAGVKQVQPSRSFPPANRPRLKSQAKQLISRDHPVLSIRQLPNRPLLCASLSLGPHIGLSDGLAFHAPIVPRKSARVARGLCLFRRVCVPEA